MRACCVNTRKMLYCLRIDRATLNQFRLGAYYLGMKAQPANDNAAPRDAQIIDLAQARATRLPSRDLERELLAGLIDLQNAVGAMLNAPGVWNNHPALGEALLKAGLRSAHLLKARAMTWWRV